MPVRLQTRYGTDSASNVNADMHNGASPAIVPLTPRDEAHRFCAADNGRYTPPPPRLAGVTFTEGVLAPQLLNSGLHCCELHPVFSNLRLKCIFVQAELGH